MGAATASIFLAERFKAEVQKSDQPGIAALDTYVFSVASSGTEARLYISYIHENNYETQLVKGFLLYDPDHYLSFKRHVLNIFDWGRTRRLEHIKQWL